MVCQLDVPCPRGTLLFFIAVHTPKPAWSHEEPTVVIMGLMILPLHEVTLARTRARCVHQYTAVRASLAWNQGTGSRVSGFVKNSITSSEISKRIARQGSPDLGRDEEKM